MDSLVTSAPCVQRRRAANSKLGIPKPLTTIKKNSCKKLGYLKKHVLQNAGVTGLQEIHGTDEDTKVLLHELALTHRIFQSHGDSVAAGGVASLWNLTSFPSSIEFDVPKEIVPGRVLRTAGKFHGKYLIHYNVHNHGLSAQQLKQLKKAIDEDILLYNANPTGVAIILSGDLNFVEDGSYSRHLKGGSDNVFVDKAKHTAERKRWLPLLAKFACVEVRADTHYNASANTIACIDRTYVMAPSWILAMLHVAGHVYDDPVRLYNLGISDHAPCGVAFSPFLQQPKERQRIAHRICKTEEFAKLHDTYCQAAKLDELAPIPRWETHKLIIMQVASVIRNNDLSRSELAECDVVTALASMARFVLANNRRGAEFAISNSVFAASCGRMALADLFLMRFRLRMV